MSGLLKNWSGLAVVAALGGGFVAAQAVMGQGLTIRPGATLDPFNPQVRPILRAVATDVGTGELVLPIRKPPLRDPFRPPTRSPFRP